MQGSIDTALQLVAAGNAFLRGEDVSGFWPDARTFVFTKDCDFRGPPEGGGDDFPLVAEDPLVWFQTLRTWCVGLRLYNSASLIQPGQMAGISERQSIAFVGGGPRWLVEAVGRDRSELWEGFQRLGDQADPQQKMWRTTWILQGEHSPYDAEVTHLDPAVAGLAAVLPEIAAFAHQHGLDNFAGLFERSIRTLAADGPSDDMRDEDILRYGHATPEEARALEAVGPAWVFGGMGSWNDLGGVPDPYEELSEQLFRALCNVVCGVANSTFRR